MSNTIPSTLIRAACGFIALVALASTVAAHENPAERGAEQFPIPQAEPQPLPTGDPTPTAPLPGYWQPGGYEGRIGSPYYYSVPRTYGANPGTAGPALPPGMLETAPQSNAPWGASPGVFAPRGHGAPLTIDPYTYHFGPGFHRHSDYGHFRFPYYSYRRPWYFPGHPVYNRDTNFAW